MRIRWNDKLSIWELVDLVLWAVYFALILQVLHEAVAGAEDGPLHELDAVAHVGVLLWQLKKQNQ